MIKIVLFISLVYILISCYHPTDFGHSYKLDYNANSYLVLKDSSNNILINPVIEFFRSDSNYVIIKQNPIDSICECNIDCLEKSGRSLKYQISACKYAIKHSVIRLYWVVEIRKNRRLDVITKSYTNIYGPFKKEELYDTLKSLEVSDYLINSVINQNK
jgi:hypothetical protein